MNTSNKAIPSDILLYPIVTALFNPHQRNNLYQCADLGAFSPEEETMQMRKQKSQRWWTGQVNSLSRQQDCCAHVNSDCDSIQKTTQTNTQQERKYAQSSTSNQEAPCESRHSGFLQCGGAVSSTQSHSSAGLRLSSH